MGTVPDRSDPVALGGTDPGARRTRAGLVALLVVVVGHLVFGDNPFSDGIAGRRAEGAPLRPADYWVTYGWWASLVLAVALAALRLGWRRWLPGAAGRQAAFAPPPSVPRWWWTATLAAVLLGGALGLPRLDHGFWQDEEHSVRGAISGAYLADDAGELRFWSTDLEDVFLYDTGPNNHVGFTVLAKGSVVLWSALTRPGDRRPSELAVRLPAYLLGLASIASVSWLGFRVGMPAAGAFAAALLALHPWHLRFLSEARGYSLLLCGSTLGLALLWNALELSSWRRWLLYAATQFAVLWTFPAAVYPVLFASLLAVAGLWSLHGPPRTGSVPWTRFAVTSGGSALLWLVLMAGNIAIVASYLESKQRDLNAGFLRELASLLASGTPWRVARDPAALYPELSAWAASAPIAFWAFAAASALVLAVGGWRLARLRPLGAGLLAALVAPAFLAGAVHAWRSDFIYARNLVYALPGLALLLGAGFSALPGRAALPLAAAWLLVFAWATEPMRGFLRRVPVQPYRESVLVTRPSLDLADPAQRGILTASFSGEGFYYDPWLHMIGEPEELSALMERADREGLPLFVNLGRLRLAARREPELLAMVEDPARFEEIARLPGQTPDFSRRVYRYRGGSAP